MLHCPSCETSMERTRVGDTEIDGCASCGGLWLDKGELQRLGNNPRKLYEAAMLFLPRLPASPGASPRRCPHCLGPLAAFEFNSLRGISLDRCQGCEGVFLDHGEAQAIEQRLL